MSAQGPQITFSDKEKEIYKALFVQLATKTKTLSEIQAVLASDPRAFPRFKVYAAMTKETLQARQQIATLENQYREVSAECDALLQQKQIHEQNIKNLQNVVEQSRSSTVVAVTKAAFK